MSGASTWKDRCWVLLYSVKPILDTQCVQYSSINCIFAIDSSEPDCSIQPCIWSCPTYPLAFLPIHAARIYSQGRTPVGSGSWISDYVVSLYTLTITALDQKKKEALAENEKPTSVLLISLLLTLGQSPILGEKQKNSHIQENN